jgi:predicted kinase
MDSENVPDMPMLSLDDLRIKMGILPTDNQGQVMQAAQNELKKLLRAKRPFVYNATNLTADRRAKFVQLFENYGAKVRIVHLETEWKENLRRNADRKAAVPENVIGSMLGGCQMPEAMEAQDVEWLCV